MKGPGRAILIGLFVGGIVAALLGYRFTSGAVQAQKAELGERQATMVSMALAELVGKALSGGDASAEPVALQAMVLDWDRARDDVADIRVLRISGARLLASSVPADIARGVDKRLAREDKDFFDQAKALASGQKTNIQEGGFRKEELVYEALEDGRVRVTAPYLIDDTIEGAVRMDVTPGLETETVSPLNAIIALLAPLLLFGLLALVLKREDRWIPLAIGVVFLFGAFFWFTNSSLGDYRDARLRYETQLATYYTAVRNQADTLAGQHLPDAGLERENVWDTDAFRRPLGFFDARGSVDEGTIRDALALPAGQLSTGLWFAAILGLLFLIFFGAGWAGRGWRTLKTYREAYAYISPAMIGMVVLVFFPFAYGIILSFTGQTLYNTDKALWDIWVGLDNYGRILFDWQVFSKTDSGATQINFSNFYWTLFITVMWTVVNVCIGVSVGLALALSLNVKGFHLKPIYRAILILPWAIPTYVTSLIWKGLFHKQFGPINYIITLFGGEPISWFDSVFTSFMTGIMVNGWLSFPFMMVISLGGLQSINSDMYEAARLDGASRLQQFRFITLPSLKPTLIPAIIISIVWTFNLFNVIYLVSAGAPGGANEILVTKAYKIAFQEYQYGYAAAYSTVIFMILCAYGIFQNKVSRATEDIAA